MLCASLFCWWCQRWCCFCWSDQIRERVRWDKTRYDDQIRYDKAILYYTSSHLHTSWKKLDFRSGLWAALKVQGWILEAPFSVQFSGKAKGRGTGTSKHTGRGTGTGKGTGTAKDTGTGTGTGRSRSLNPKPEALAQGSMVVPQGSMVRPQGSLPGPQGSIVGPQGSMVGPDDVRPQAWFQKAAKMQPKEVAQKSAQQETTLALGQELFEKPLRGDIVWFLLLMLFLISCVYVNHREAASFWNITTDDKSFVPPCLCYCLHHLCHHQQNREAQSMSDISCNIKSLQPL